MFGLHFSEKYLHEKDVKSLEEVPRVSLSLEMVKTQLEEATVI